MAKSKKKLDNSPEARIRRRRNLWVVSSGRMKQYGDTVVESPGQVIRREFMRNDQKLLDIEYVRPVEESENYKKCKACGRTFLGNSTSLKPDIRHIGIRITNYVAKNS